VGVYLARSETIMNEHEPPVEAGDMPSGDLTRIFQTLQQLSTKVEGHDERFTEVRSDLKEVQNTLANGNGVKGIHSKLAALGKELNERIGSLEATIGRRLSEHDTELALVNRDVSAHKRSSDGKYEALSGSTAQLASKLSDISTTTALLKEAKRRDMYAISVIVGLAASVVGGVVRAWLT
jgi:prefoldin subunit 5